MRTQHAPGLDAYRPRQESFDERGSPASLVYAATENRSPASRRYAGPPHHDGLRPVRVTAAVQDGRVVRERVGRRQVDPCLRAKSTSNRDGVDGMTVLELDLR